MKLTNIVKGAACKLLHGKKVAAMTFLTATMSLQSFAQCSTAILNISTGMDATSGTPTLVTPGSPDPKWIVTNITTDITSVVGGLPAPPYNAVAVTSIGGWAAPASNTNWISFYNPASAGSWYNTPTNNSAPNTYAVTLRRYFKLCKEEELYIQIDGARDNYISNISLDGTGSLFSEAPSISSANFSSATSLVNVVTMAVPAGTHYIEVTYNNHYTTSTSNPHAVYLTGTISTNSGIASIVTDACEDCDGGSEACNDKCYWKVEGNNILNGNNIFGTLTDHDIHIKSNNMSRGVIKGGGTSMGGFFGWNTMTPTARFHVNCNNGNDGMPSDIRFEDLEAGEGTILVIDKDGYVYNSHVPVGQESPVAPEVMNMKEEIRELKMQLAELRQTLATGSVDKYNAQVQNELYQNNPNPFGKETSLGYNIVNMQQGAFIAVYDLNGKEIFRQAVTEKGKGSITLSGDKLVPGMYLYSLIIDGKETATKRMVVTK